MKKSVFWVCGIAIIIAACTSTNSSHTNINLSTDTLAYGYKTTKVRAADCGDDPDVGCTIAHLYYPVFAADSGLNDTVKSKLSNLKLLGMRPAKSLKTMTENFIADYYKYYENLQNKTLSKRPFKGYLFFVVVRQDSELVAMEYGGEGYVGGLHGVHQRRFLNWDRKVKKEIHLQDILIDNFKEPLNNIAEQIFRKSENLKDTSSLSHDYFFKDNKFSLKDNFLITPIGLQFSYNDGEIKPYVEGPIDLLIPYSRIKTLLRPNTVISQYIK